VALLYKDLVLVNYDHDSLRYLLFTTLSRLDAALYIENFAIRDRTSPRSNPLENLFKDDDLPQRMRDDTDTIRAKIYNLLRSYRKKPRAVKLRYQWTVQFFWSTNSWPYMTMSILTSCKKCRKPFPGVSRLWSSTTSLSGALGVSYASSSP
jgi:hypothetical protein